MRKKPLVSIVILNYNTCELTLNLLDSIERNDSFEIILVDNNSTDGSWESFKKLKIPNLVAVRNRENLGFSRGVNVGIRRARGEYILLLNSDVKVKKGSILALVNFARKNPDAGVVAPKLILGNGKIQRSVFRFPTVWEAFKEFILKIKDSYGPYLPKSKKPLAVDAVVGAAFLIKREVIEKVGLFDERYFMYFEDIDYCRRVWKAGYKVYYLPTVSMIHYHGQSGKSLVDEQNQWKRLVPSSKIYNGLLKHYLINFIIRISNFFSGEMNLTLKSNKRSFILGLITLILIFPTFIHLVKPGYFPMHDDIQAFRLQQMDKCVKDFQIPCRWVPDMGYGYGYPQFNYYGPLPYYLMEIFHLVGFGFLDSTKIGFLLSIILSAFGMYLLGKSLWGIYGGLIASVFYVYGPYRAVNIYVRGAMGEAWGMAILPFIFWSTKEVFGGKKYSKIWLALSIAALFSSHNVTALMFIPFYGLWVLYLALSKFNNLEELFKKIKGVLFANVWGLAMSAFFVLPAYFEKKYAHVETMLMGYFNYLAHYVGLGQLLFARSFGYGSSVWGPDDDMLLSPGIIHWLVPSALIIIFYILGIIKNAKEAVLFFFFAWFSLFMIHPRSVFIWERISILSYLQFPWRFLLIATFSFSVVTGSLSLLIERFKKYKYLLLILALFLPIIFNFYYFRPEKTLYITDSDKFSGESWQKQLTISIFDYLPIYAKFPPDKKAPDEPFFVDGGGDVVSGEKGTNWQRWVLQVEEDDSKVVFPLYYFPIWKAKVNGEISEITYNNDLGLITLELGKGKNEVYLKLYDTPLRKFSNYISLISIMFVPFYLFKESKGKSSF